MRLILVCLSLLCITLGCVKSRLVVPVQKQDLGADWIPIQIKGAEQAWIIPNEGSSLLIDSTCKVVDQSTPLVALTAQLLIGMTEQALLEQQFIPYQNREALISTFDLKIDGIPSKLHALVLKKDGCVFDIVLTCSPDNYTKRLADFERLQSLFALEPSEP